MADELREGARLRMERASTEKKASAKQVAREIQHRGFEDQCLTLTPPAAGG